MESEVSSGYDIALIGIEHDHYGRLEDFVKYNKQQMEKENNQNTYLSYFQETKLYDYYEMALETENELTKFQLGVCGYPADEDLYTKKGYP